MIKIVLFCTAGMSINMLVKKIQEAALNKRYDCIIEAHPIVDADIALLGPQVHFQMKKVIYEVDCPVIAIDMAAYGTMGWKKC